MGKKNKDDSPNPNSVPNRDIMQRLNFLYQASSYLNGLGAALSQPGPSNSVHSTEGNDRWIKDKEKDADSKKKNTSTSDTRKSSGQRKATAHDLARSYVKSMKTIGQKTNVKMDPTVKHTMCKGCNTLLMPCVTARVRVKPLPSHGHAVYYTCMNCSFRRRIPAPPTTESIYGPSTQPGIQSIESPQQMDTDPVDALLDKVNEEASASTEVRGKRKQSRIESRKKFVKPRSLPFFDRPEHMVFVGNERVDRKTEDIQPN